MLKAENISKSFIDRSNGKTFELLHDVSLEIKAGEAVALMGGSGSGKSTLARILLRLLSCDSGKIYFQGQDITKVTGKDLSVFRRNVQFISQRPESFLDPRQTLGCSLKEAFTVFNLSYDEEKSRRCWIGKAQCRAFAALSASSERRRNSAYLPGKSTVVRAETACVG